MKTSLSKLATLVMGLQLALVSLSPADTSPLWNIQFSRNINSPVVQTGAAVIGNAGDTWNFCLNGTDTQPKSLVDSNGQATSATISWTAKGGLTAQDTAASYGFYGTEWANLMRGCIYTTKTPYTLTIAGLTASTGYTIYLYSQGDSGCTGRTLYATTDTGTYTTTAADATANSFILGQNYLEFTGHADALGNLTITYGSTTEADLNGLQITTMAVPEPATCGMLILGAAGLLLARRCRK